MAELKIFPGNETNHIPEALRKLADMVEQGEYGGAFNLAWVIDCGKTDGGIVSGLMGPAVQPAATAHFLLCLGQRSIEDLTL